jgi:hypothetical protein
MSGYSAPEYLDKHPEFPGNCYPCEVSLRPESPDPYVWSIRTYTRSIRVPFTQWLVFCERGYKYPPYPFIHLSLAHLNQNIPASKRRALSLPLFHFEWFSLGIRVRLLQEQRFVLVSFHFISWAQHPCLAGGFSLLLLELQVPRWLGIACECSSMLWAPQEVYNLYSSWRNT